MQITCVNKRLVSRKHKEFFKLNNKKKSQPNKEMGKTFKYTLQQTRYMNN